MKSYTLTGIKTFRGMEGYGINATIRRDGKPVAFVMDHGDGGMMQVDFRNPGQSPVSFQKHADTWQSEQATAEKAALDWLANDPEAQSARDFDAELTAKYPDSHRPPTGASALEDWINAKVDQWEQAREKARMDRLATQKTLFRLPGDKDGEWRYFKQPPSTPGLLDHLKKKYPTAILYGA